MKNTTKLIVALVLSTLAFAASAQVKQVFQVLHFETQKPIVGVTSSLYGQTLTTNANGVAVANLPADQKGAFLPLEQWRKDGLYYLGRVPSSYYCYYQTSDTIKFYMVETSKYRKAVEDQTVRLYRRWYDKSVLEYINSMTDSVRNNPDKAAKLANDMVEATMDANKGTPLRRRYLDGGKITRYYIPLFERPPFLEVLDLLRTGEADSAQAIVRRHIDTTDNSRENLDWINLYRQLQDLYMGPAEDSISNYTYYLYKNPYPFYEVGEYIQDLKSDGRFDLADSICRIEKANNRNPRFSSTFEPSWVRYMNEKDYAKMKTVAEKAVNTNKSVYAKYPFVKTLGDMYWISKNMYRVYVHLKDSVSATRTIDSALIYLDQYLKSENGDDYHYRQAVIEENQYVLDALDIDRSYIPEQTVSNLYDAIYDAAKANYESDTASLFLKLQLAENALSWLQGSPAAISEEQKERKIEILKQLNDVLTNLSGEFPKYFSLQNVQTAAQLLASCLVNQSESREVEDAFNRYERSYDLVSAVFPGLFEDSYLHYNNMFESYLTSGPTLSNELSNFNEKLLKVKAGNDPQKLLVLKAEQANKMAETLYSEEAYDEAVGYYLQSNEYYEKAIPNDAKLWIPYLRNYLQMGDAYLYQNQFDKALMTYQKILDFEPQIPASMIPEYTTMKGSVNYYNGDVYKATGDQKRAEKEYKAAEKWYKKSIALGDTSAYPLLGEMYLSKASTAVQQKDYKKCMQLLEKSVGYYESCGMDRPLNRYERGKATLGMLYQMFGRTEDYYKNTVGLVDFYRKFATADRDYAAGLVENAEEMLNSGEISYEEALAYSHDILNGLMILQDQGEGVELPMLRAMFNMGKVYTANDSIEKAIDIFKACIPASEYIFADTDMETHTGNLIEIYKKLAGCYESMAEDIDTAHAERWYYRAIDTRDTLIDLMKGVNVDGDPEQTYQMAMEYRKNGNVFYELDMVPSAQDYYDKSNELLLMLYNSEYKSEVEADIIQNYVLKAMVYEDAEKKDLAIENLRTAISYGERADLSQEVPLDYYVALTALIEMLGDDPATNAAEISKLNKQLKEISKKMKA